MSKLIGYVRVSTREQATEGYSLAAQRLRLEAYALAHNHVLVGVIEDGGCSGSNMARQGLQQALTELREGRADGLLVTKLDRLTRSVRDFNVLVEDYFAKRYTLASIGDNIDTTTASGRLVLNVLISVFQWEREAIAERVKEGMAQARREGVRFGPRPLMGGAHTRALELKAEGRSLREIATQLKAEGFKTARGGEWAAQTVKLLLARAA